MVNDSRERLLKDVQTILQSQDTPTKTYERVLAEVLTSFQCVVGTVHTLNRETNHLELQFQRGIPDAILGIVQNIPVGKGMAGLAAERREPVQVCNLQTDDSGVAKPGAKETKMEGSISFPMIADGELRGTMGVAKPTAYEFSADEADLLLRVGELVARYLGARE